MKHTKPYFSKDTVDKVVSVIQSELAKENKAIDEASLRSYIQSHKNQYENSILVDVANGHILASVSKDEIAYKVASPSTKEVDDVIELAKKQDEVLRENEKIVPDIPSPKQVELAIVNARSAKLSHAMNMIAFLGGARKLGVEAVSVAPAAVESNETLETATA